MFEAFGFLKHPRRNRPCCLVRAGLGGGLWRSGAESPNFCFRRSAGWPKTDARLLRGLADGMALLSRHAKPLGRWAGITLPIIVFLVPDLPIWRLGFGGLLVWCGHGADTGCICG